MYELLQVEFVPFKSQDELSDEMLEKIAPILEKLQKYLTQGCFYGLNVDLTQYLQRQADQKNEGPGFDSNYMWNYSMCRELIS